MHGVAYCKAPDGTVHRKVKRCYLGPNDYVNVSRLHADSGLTFKGLVEDGRELEYVKGILRALKEKVEADRVSPEQYPRLSSNLNEIKGMVEDLIKIVTDTGREVESTLNAQRPGLEGSSKGQP
ncbi:MAG: hypothetical protein RXR09_03735 [Acidilobus sp.]